MEEKENLSHLRPHRSTVFERLKCHLRKIHVEKMNAEHVESKKQLSPHQQESVHNQNYGFEQREEYVCMDTNEVFVPLKQVNFGEEPASHCAPLGRLGRITRSQCRFTPPHDMKAWGSSLSQPGKSRGREAYGDSAYHPSLKRTELRGAHEAVSCGVDTSDGRANKSAFIQEGNYEPHSKFPQPSAGRETQKGGYGFVSSRKQEDPVWPRRKFQDMDDERKAEVGIRTRAKERPRIMDEDQEGSNSSRSTSGKRKWKQIYDEPLQKATSSSPSRKKRTLNPLRRRGMSAERNARLKEVLGALSPRLLGWKKAGAYKNPQPSAAGITPLEGRKRAASRLCLSSRRKGTPRLIGKTGQSWSVESKASSQVSRNLPEEKGASQMCVRALQFEEEVEEEKDEDTEPLGNLDTTPVLENASVLKAPFNSNCQPKENFQPVIKKTLLYQSTENFKIQRNNYNLRSHQTRKNHEPATEMGGTSSNIPSDSQMQNVSHGSSSTGVLRNQSTSQSVKKGYQTLRNNVTDETKHTSSSYQTSRNNGADEIRQASSNSTRKGKPVKPTKVVTRRRSGIPLSSHTPINKARRRSGIPVSSRTPGNKSLQANKAKSVSKMLNPPAQKSMGRLKQRRSLPRNYSHIHDAQDQKVKSHTLNINQHPKVPAVVVTPASSEEEEKEAEMEKESVDVATNTSLQLLPSWTAGAQIEDDVKKLVEEVESIQVQAKLLSERTIGRRQMMQEFGLLESLTTTSSPLRRLKARLMECREQLEDKTQATAQENMKCSAMEEDDSLIRGTADCISTTPDITMQECSSHNTTTTSPNLNHTSLNTTNIHNTSALHWSQLKCDYQFLQTPSSVAPKRNHSRTINEEETEDESEEGFRVKNFVGDESQSPFSQLVGDCDRPSLAPMTPHSRQHVSMLKISLKKQLDDLYDD